MVLPKRKTNLSSVLSKPANKYNLPKNKKLSSSGFASKARAISLGFAVGAAGLFGAKAVKETMAQRRAEKVVIQKTIAANPHLINNPNWVKIREVAGLNTNNMRHVNLMTFVDEVSQKTGVAPDRVISTFLNYGSVGAKELNRLELNLRHLEKSPRSEAANLKRQKRIVGVMEFSKDPRYKEFFVTIRDVPKIWAYK